ncbi:MotA/TolQ/ExbB proton channel family protein [Methylotuvimicrobium buryatense]|uniref:MotA/TolQ/ExbB proton channel family protein n=1 Tax=Methylotuvimicrobium buryatense TaxID=95641 RepID=A0A4P9UV82_METBY|nr:MotA/TolQ/ExbB proton channel family protein [Methylotuvimicrobium buryatense]QCW84670.1 MotA/TolQ/ExbB proton channel family protein [Methylotuvimicrobium buryatense]
MKSTIRNLNSIRQALWVLCLCFAAVPAVMADSPKTLDELIKQVRSDSVLESRELAEREREFRNARDRQAALLQSVKTKLAAERQRGAELKNRYETNEPAIKDKTERLHERMGALGELFGIVRQTSKDMLSLFSASIISAQLPDRKETAKLLAERKSNPNIQELEKFWHLLLDEMVQAGKVARFVAPVITADGQESRREVVRIGAFNAVSDGLYLRYLPETGRLVELGRQPQARFLTLAKTLEESKDGISPVALDPSRGAILSLMVQKPDWSEHIEQGGVIGYLIIGLGLIGLLLAAERTFSLTRLHRKMQEQRSDSEAEIDTAIRRLREVAQEHPKLDADALGLKLDQAILGERPKIKRFLPTIAIFASVAPLLGLLGTVTGMIETFQAITLFGTGDPKLMSGGISGALVTTEMGLVVAIPLLLLHSWLNGNTRKLIYLLDEESAALVASRGGQVRVVTG